MNSTITNTIKKIADNSVGLINQTEQSLIQNLDPGNTNLFQFILYPKTLDDMSLAKTAGGSTLMGAVNLAQDTLIAQVYIRQIDVQFMSLEYERINEIQSPKKITFPDAISMQILEDEYGFVGNYLYKWMNSIVYPIYEKDPQTSFSRTNYIWANNQEAAKKNATLIPQTGLGLPSLRLIRFYGLKLQNIESVSYSHGNGDPLIYTVTCAVDSVWFKPLF